MMKRIVAVMFLASALLIAATHPKPSNIEIRSDSEAEAKRLLISVLSAIDGSHYYVSVSKTAKGYSINVVAGGVEPQ